MLAPLFAEASESAPLEADGLPPLLLPLELRLSTEPFALVREVIPDALLDLAADGQQILMTPAEARPALATTASAWLWGWRLVCAPCRSSCSTVSAASACPMPQGFSEGVGSVFSPEASAVRLERWQALMAEQRRHCAARWLSTESTAPGWVVCTFPRSEWRRAGGRRRRARLPGKRGAWQWPGHRSGSSWLNPRSLPALLDLDSRSARTG